MKDILCILVYFIYQVEGQINLGQFNLQQGNNGVWDLGFNQGGSILGFGADRGFNAQVGEGVFGLTGNQGGTVGGQRIGSDSGIGISPGGLNLGSALNFGNGQPSTQPTGDFTSFIKGIESFFKGIIPQGTSGVNEGSGIKGMEGIEMQIVTAKDGDVRREEKEEQLLLMSTPDVHLTSIPYNQSQFVPSLIEKSQSEERQVEDSDITQ